MQNTKGIDFPSLNSNLSISISDLDLAFKNHQYEFKLLITKMQNYVAFLEKEIELQVVENELKISNDTFSYLKKETIIHTSNLDFDNKQKCIDYSKTSSSINLLKQESKIKHDLMLLETSVMWLPKKMKNTNSSYRKGTRFVCPIEDCSRVLSRKDSLNRHLRTKHKIGLKKEFPCLFPGCQKIYNEHWILMGHQRKGHKTRTLTKPLKSREKIKSKKKKRK